MLYSSVFQQRWTAKLKRKRCRNRKEKDKIAFLLMRFLSIPADLASDFILHLYKFIYCSFSVDILRFGLFRPMNCVHGSVRVKWLITEGVSNATCRNLAGITWPRTWPEVKSTVAEYWQHRHARTHARTHTTTLVGRQVSRDFTLLPRDVTYCDLRLVKYRKPEYLFICMYFRIYYLRL